MNKINLFTVSFLTVLSFNNKVFADNTIPAEYFACYSNYNSMQMSPNGDYIAIVSPPRDNKCDIETDLQKYVEDDFRVED